MARILMISSEAAPWAKTGGLGDVLGSLPPALAAGGEEVAVLLPAYGNIVPGASVVISDLPIWLGIQRHQCSLLELQRRGVTYYFLHCPGLFGRAGFYGDAFGDFGDNHIRFGVLCRAAFVIAAGIWRPDIFHCHDWQAALVPIYHRTTFSQDPVFQGIKTILTLHNLGYQGVFGQGRLYDLGVPVEQVWHPGALEHFGEVNLLKGGILLSDFLTTVSRRYAQEIQTPAYGFGMDGILRARSSHLEGILNGVDYTEWNPEHDKHIPAHYSADDLAGKRLCKQKLLEEMNLATDNLDRPLLGIVSRLASQKGLDLVAQCIVGLADLDLQMVVLGAGDAGLEETFGFFATARPEQFAFWRGYNEGLAHRIEAGSDMFLMPSRYEPCGLNQIFSLRYGTVPLVRATGGLDDTIDEETGFKFWGISAHELYMCVKHAVEAFQNQESWTRMMRQGMSKDYSWDASAAQYSLLYRRLLGS